MIMKERPDRYFIILAPTLVQKGAHGGLAESLVRRGDH
jgi:hypothetical protein